MLCLHFRKYDFVPISRVRFDIIVRFHTIVKRGFRCPFLTFWALRALGSWGLGVLDFFAWGLWDFGGLGLWGLGRTVKTGRRRNHDSCNDRFLSGFTVLRFYGFRFYGFRFSLFDFRVLYFTFLRLPVPKSFSPADIAQAFPRKVHTPLPQFARHLHVMAYTAPRCF